MSRVDPYETPLGRTTKRTVNGVEETYAFDTLGRLQSDTNALGTFTYGYDGVTSRLNSAGYPNGQTTALAYLDNTQDNRLSQIKHLTPSGAILDQFDYSYDGPMGRISHWGQQQPGATPGTTATNTYDLSYDARGQIKRATINADNSSQDTGVWNYDAAGNRTGVQAGSGTLSTMVPTSTNAQFSLRGEGSVRVAGALSKWAQVSVNGQAASVDTSSNTFEAAVPLAVGAQTLTINATDAGGNTASSRYQLAITAGTEEDFSYDSNGNTTALSPVASGVAAQGMEWDALNRVVAIVQGSHRTEFGYAGSGKRVRITEKDAGSVTTDRLYVDNEERDAGSGQLLRRFYTQGEQRVSGSSPGAYFYANDHLGSTRELTDSVGNVQASYSYTLWGARTTLQARVDTESGFTGYWHHAPSGLDLSATRLYSAAFGRFISKDPLQEGGGLNLYRYCGNNPVSRSDPSGLVWGMDGLDNSAYDGFFQGAADFASNFGSFATFGASDWAEDALGLSSSIDKCSWSYKAGGAAAFLVGMLDGESEAEEINLAERCLFGCFVAGTLVDTAKGERPIESVQEGDLVWSKDIASGTAELRPVTNTFHRTSADEVNVELSSGETVHTTPEHPFWVVGVGWCRAENLGAGEVLSTEDQHEAKVVAATHRNSSAEVFNFSIEHAHTYFVGAERILVHNNCAGESAAEEGLVDLAKFREELGPIPGGGIADGGVLARLDVGGQSFYGINAHGTEITLSVNAITATHAEADVFQQAFNAGVRGGDAILYVDAALCKACGLNGGVMSMARQLGLDTLKIITP